jgi:hypothetical protein
MNMKRLLYLLPIVSLILVTSCEIIEEPTVFEPDQPDQAGNLLIINNSGEQLVLYKDQQVIKKIPASATDFLVDVSNPSEGSVQLDLYLWEDVYEDVEHPDPSLAYKTWLVPLSNSTSIEKRATWHVDGIEQYTNVATLNLSYFGGTDYMSDVYLNGKTGAKIASMKPGDQYKKVGIDYGNYTLHYLYWFSNQNDNNAFEEVGWIEKQVINDEEKDIWLILNENRKDVTMIIPHHGSTLSQGVKYAGLNVDNQSGDPVIIEVNNKLIEYVCFLENGSTENLSTIEALGKYTYYIPITEQDATTIDVTLTASHLTNGTYVEGPETITLTADETTTWIVDGQ